MWIYKLLSVTTIAGLSTISLYKRNRELRRKNSTLVASVEGLIEYTLYLADMLDRSNLEVTEFDKIALNQIVENSKRDS